MLDMALQVAVYKRSLLVSNEKKQCKEQVKEATTYEKLQSEAMDLKTKRCERATSPCCA